MKVIEKEEELTEEETEDYNEDLIQENFEIIPLCYSTKIERNIMVNISKINDPFLLRIKSAFQDSINFYIISEYIPGKDLWHYFSETKKFGGEFAKFYAIEILLGLETLHALNIVHNDLKFDNILVDTDGHIKICDFGCGRVQKPNRVRTEVVGTPLFMAPEIIGKKGYNKMVDWCSFGVILYIMISGKEPLVLWETEEKIRFEMLDSFSDAEKDLLKGLLNPDPKKRLGSKNGAKEIKEHKYFKGVIWDEYRNKKIDGPFKHSPENLQEERKEPIPNEKVIGKGDGYIKFRNFTYVSKTLLDERNEEIKDDDNNQNQNK
jgi:serine/threonine protein kinase